MIVNLMWWAENLAQRFLGLKAMDSSGLFALAIAGIIIALIQDIKEIRRP